MLFAQYTSKTAQETLDILQTSIEGLSEKEVILRQNNFGKNEVKSKKKTADIIVSDNIVSFLLHALGITHHHRASASP